MIRARQSILIGIFLSWVSAPSLAFEACAIEKLSVPSLHKQISEFVLLSVPAKYLDVAQAIELQVPEREPKLIPYCGGTRIPANVSSLFRRSLRKFSAGSRSPRLCG